ncbi:hypothetical protein C9417_00125 [Rhizobium sp. SEMIA 4088]|nr:hypothetical protein C9417_00125 [Rhizobium sp. SEMIA 4088]
MVGKAADPGHCLESQLACLFFPAQSAANLCLPMEGEPKFLPAMWTFWLPRKDRSFIWLKCNQSVFAAPHLIKQADTPFQYFSIVRPTDKMSFCEPQRLRQLVPLLNEITQDLTQCTQ